MKLVTPAGYSSQEKANRDQKPLKTAFNLSNSDNYGFGLPCLNPTISIGA
jgi:hypothetical protein